MGGVFSFSKMRTFTKGVEPSSADICEQGGVGSVIGHFYVNAIIRWPLAQNSYKMEIELLP